MLHTKLCEALRIELPILGAPMGPAISSPELAAAVSSAGGLCIMSFGGYPPPALKQQIRRLRSLTNRPFGVNIILGGPSLPFPESDVVTACIEERVPVISFFWGDPTPYVKAIHRAGLKVIDQVGSVAAAERSARAGADAIVAQGFEAGGHVAGKVGTMAFVPRVVDAISPVPVVAAGGIADARGMVAALALGAQGVMLGTRLIATPEARAHALYKQKILAATEENTVYTTLFGGGWPGAPHRTLRTPFVEQWFSEECRGSEGSRDEPVIGETMLGGMNFPVYRFSSLSPSTETTGDIESMDFLAGQSVGLVREVKPAAVVVREMYAEAERIIRQQLLGALK